MLCKITIPTFRLLRRAIPLPIALVLLVSASAGAKDGAVRSIVVANDYENPSLARVYLAESHRDFGVIVNVEVGGGKTERIPKKSLVQIVTLPGMEGDLVYPGQFAAVQETLDRLSALVETYPQFREKLLAVGTELKAVVDAGKQGLIREGGRWRQRPAMEPKLEAGPVLTFRDNSGREFKEATVKKVDPDGLLLSHAGGVGKVPFTDLPKDIQERFGYNPEAAMAFRASREAKPGAPMSEGVGMPAETTDSGNPSGAKDGAAPAAGEKGWRPQTPEEVAECSLFVEVSKGIDKDGLEGASWNGSAFLCNVGGATYVYSNAHNFDGAEEFRVFDQTGKEYSEFVSVEIAAEGEAHWRKARWGGDVVRLRLPQFVERALTLDSRRTDESFAERRILITGNTKGRGEITRLEGQITAIEPEQILIHNAATQGGNSGSPIVDLESWSVIGILTWGRYDDENPLMRLWSRKPEEAREGINSGAGLAGLRFVPTSFEALYRQRLVMAMLRRNTRLLGLLDTLIPTKEGLFVDIEKTVMGGYTVDDLLQESSDHAVVAELVALHELLKTRGASNIGISNHDMFKLYVDTYRKCLREIAAHRGAIEASNSASFYMKCQIDHARLLQISRTYEAVLADSLDWFERQLGTRGQAIPLGDRIRLPAMESGLGGLGIEE